MSWEGKELLDEIKNVFEGLSFSGKIQNSEPKLCQSYSVCSEPCSKKF